MDDRTAGDDAPSELGAAEALSGRGDDTQQGPVTCPTCGRVVEAGFRFCDGCGTRLEAEAPVQLPPTEPPTQTPMIRETEPPPPTPEAPTPKRAEAVSRFARLRRLVIQAPPPDEADLALADSPATLEAPPEVTTPVDGPAGATSRPKTPEPIEPQPATEHLSEEAPSDQASRTNVEEPVPLIERWRRRRAERSALGKAEQALSDSPPTLETAPEVTAPAPVERPGGATSRPKTAEELYGARPAIGGRLRWTEEEKPTAEEVAPAPAVWRPVPMPEQAAATDGVSWGRFAMQFFASLLAGAIALIALAALASVASDGRVALLEVRGLPIFIGGAVSIIVFALLRTSERNRAPTTRRGTIVGVVIGLIGLVVLAAILYQPALAEKLQPRIERALQVFGSEDDEALEAFEERVVEWNESATSYHDELEVALRNRENVERLRGSAVEAETTLEGITGEMQSAADRAQHPELRDALGDLTSIYVDQLGGLRLVNRGLLVDNIELVRTGDARFKEAHERAGALYQARLRSLLDRGGFDADSFGRAIAG